MVADGIVITGGAGFIGSALAERLSENNDIVVVDNLSTGRRENVPWGTTFVEGDLSDRRTFEALEKYDFDSVLHLAGQSSGEKSFDDPEYDLNSHVMSTFNLLQWCHLKGIDRLLYASSMSVYGDPEYLPVDERHPLNPKTYYGAGKLGAEAYVKLFDNLGMNTTIFRLFSVYGPGQNLENMKQGMVSIYLSFVLDGADLLVKGPLDRFRDFVYVKDVVDAWVAAIDAPETYGGTFNVARGVRVNVSTLIESILDRCGEPDYPVKVTSGTLGDQFGIYGDFSRLRAAIDWSPDVSLEEGLGRMIHVEAETQ